MIIGIACPNCGKSYDVPRKLAGRRVRCKQCHTNFRVPHPQPNVVHRRHQAANAG